MNRKKYPNFASFFIGNNIRLIVAIFVFFLLAGLYILRSLIPNTIQTGEVILYENNFENPRTTDCLYQTLRNGQSTYGAKEGSFAQDYDTSEYPHIQIGTADRLCVGPGGYIDSTGKAGKYLGGFIAYVNQPRIESWGLILYGHKRKFINITIDTAKVDTIRSPYLSDISNTSTITASFYAIGSGQQVLLSQSTRGNPGSVAIRGSNINISPFYTTKLTIPANHGKQFELNFTNQKITVPLDKIDSTMKVLTLFTITNGSGRDYIAFDNLKIIASNDAITQPMSIYHTKHHIKDTNNTLTTQTNDDVFISTAPITGNQSYR